MSALSAHRSLGGRLRSELYRNVCLLSLRRPMLEELCHMLTGGPQSLDKLNQALFVQLSYYLASIIEPKLAQLITWPLYDKASERTYKTQLLSFISMYYNKDGSGEKDKWITPIQPSYLNAGGFKVMQLMFEMSQLALSKLIRRDFKPTGEKLEGCDLSKFMKQKPKLDAAIEKARKQFIDKSVKFVTHKKKAATLSENYKATIIELEMENDTSKRTLDRCIETFPENSGLVELKDANVPSEFLSDWTNFGDQLMVRLETDWTAKTRNIVSAGINCRQAGKSTVSRSTIADRSSYTIEYVPGRDSINFDKLESQVSSQQRYILKNIIKDNKLNFPNLLRGYTVAICFLFKSVRCLEPVERVNRDLNETSAGYAQLVDKGKWLIDGMHKLKMKLQEKSSQPSFIDDSGSDLAIPALPDIWIRSEPWQNQLFHKAFTPLHSSKILFNIHGVVATEFRQPRSLFQAPINTISRPTLFKNIAKLHTDDLMTTLCSNTSKTSQPEREVNRTTDCSAGFTKEQFHRLLSSRKSSAKKFKPSHKTDSLSKARRSHLFRDTPENSFTMARSLSSPNLCITSEAKKKSNVGRMIRNLYAIKQEESPDRPMEISGVDCLPTSRDGSLQKHSSLSEQNCDFKSMPSITLLKPESFRDSPRKAVSRTESPVQILNQSINRSQDYASLQPETAMKTPICRNTPAEKKRANSIEKLIEKYKRVRSNTCKTENKMAVQSPTLSPITHSPKDNDANEIIVDTSFSARLPDVVSPQYSNLSNKTSPIQPDWANIDSPPLNDKKYKCRESLGTALGVDNTFLDQFNLIE